MSKINSELALALALDGKLAKVDDDTAMLVAVVDALRALPEPEIDGNFAMALEQRLLNEGLTTEAAPVGRPQLSLVPDSVIELDEEAPISDNVFTMPTRKVRVRKSFAAIAACFMLGAFPVMASAGSLPGSPLYGVKQNLRSAKIALFGGQLQDATWRLGFAADHVHEAEALVALGANPNLVAGALDMAAYEFAKANETMNGFDDEEALAAFAKEARQTQALLAKSAPTLVPEASEAYDRALQAANDLNAALASALGIENTIAGNAAKTASSVVTTASETVTSSESTTSNPPVTTSGQSNNNGTNNGGTNNGGSNGDTGTGVGKGLRDAGNGCSVPAGTEIESVAAGATSQLCATAKTLF